MAHLLSKARAGARLSGDRNEKKGAEAEVDEIKHALLPLSVQWRRCPAQGGGGT
jgi:hypothetical protein